MSVATAAAMRSPFKGLTPFDDSDVDALLFFGRQRETEIVTANALASRLTVLYGPSGVGKSSLLRAGVAQSLRRIGATEPLAVAVFSSWSSEPLAGIEEAARAGVADALGVDPGEAPGTTADRLDSWTAALGGELCLILDQLEEFFLYHGEAPAGRAFADQLAELVTRPRLRVNVLLGLRDDALARLDAFKSRIPGLFANSLRLDRLDREAARTAVLGPLGRYNALAEADLQVSIEPVLLEAVLDEVAAGRIDTGLAGRGGVETGVGEQRIEAPYLQLVLQRLWDVERERGSGILRLVTFRELGGAERIVEDHLDRAMAALTTSQQDVAAGMFDQLVTPSGTKVAHGVADLATYAHVREDDLSPVVLALAGQRILRPLGEDGERVGDRYEIFHDVLADAVLAWRTRHDAEVALRRERLRARRRQRRLGAVTLLALLALALMAALTVYAFSQRSEAREQTELAQAAQRKAIAAAVVADQQTDRANELLADAKASKKESDDARADAEVSEADALASEADAKASEADAKASEQRATGLTVDLKQERDNALRLKDEAEQSAVAEREATRDARRQTKRALDSERAAKTATEATRRSLRTAQAEKLTAQALSLLTTDPDQSLQLVVDASHLRSTTELERATRSALLSARARAILPAGPGSVEAFATSADGHSLLAAGAEGEARVYRPASGAQVTRLHHGGPISSAAMTSDGSRVATVGKEGHINVWEVASGRRAFAVASGGRAFAVEHGSPVRAAVFSPDGSLLAAAGSDGRVSVWSARDGRLVRRLNARRDVDDVSFSRDGRTLLAVAGNALLYDASTGALVHTLDQRGEITAAELSPDGAFVATGGRDNMAFIWDARTGERLRELGRHREDVTAVAWSPDGRFVATGSVDTGVRVFQARTGVLDALLGRHANHITSVAFSPDGAALVSGSLDGTGIVWSGPLFARGEQLLGHDRAVTKVGFTPDSQRAITAGEDGSVRLWLGRADSELRGRARHDAPARAVAVSRDGRFVATAGLDGTAVIRRANGSALRTLRHPAAVNDVAFSPDGTLALTGAEDGRAYVHRVRDGHRVRSFLHGFPVAAVAFSPDGSRVASAGADGIAMIWRTRGGAVPERLLRHGGGPVGGVAFSPDGRRIATAGSDGEARVWRLADGRLIDKLPGHEAAVTSIYYSADGRKLLTASVDADLRLWDARTFDLRRILRGHSGVVSDGVFSPDGRWIATAGPTTVGLWETETGRRLSPTGPLLLRGHTLRVRSVAFAPNGRISSVGDDGSLRTWDCAICARLDPLIRLAERRLELLRRSLTPAERQRYLGRR